jgi:hypothetical protein
MLQGINDETPTHPRFRVEDWYRQHLGRFIYVNKEGDLCNAGCGGSFFSKLNYRGQYVPPSMPGQLPETGGDTEGDAEDGPRSSAVPMESLVCDDLIGEIGGAGILWPNPSQEPNSGYYTNQIPDTTDELVSSLFLYAVILSSYIRSWRYAFYDHFLNQISDLTGQSPA